MEIQVKEFTSPQNEWVKWADKQFNEKTYLKEDTAKGEYDIKEDDKGTVRYYKPGTKKLHRLNGPAAEYVDGSKYWYVDGKLHRTDGPAAEYADGSKVWYVDGKCHRTDGPAAEWPDGTKSWYIDDVKLTEKQFNEKTAKAKGLTLAEIERLLGRKVKSIEWAE
jgi:hypothetical protein